MIEDDRGLVSPKDFKKMFFTFFKGDAQAKMIYEMLAPIVTEHYDVETNERIE